MRSASGGIGYASWLVLQLYRVSGNDLPIDPERDSYIRTEKYGTTVGSYIPWNETERFFELINTRTAT